MEDTNIEVKIKDLESKVDRIKFEIHLLKATKAVQSWPKWKQDAARSALRSWK